MGLSPRVKFTRMQLMDIYAILCIAISKSNTNSRAAGEHVTVNVAKGDGHD